MSNNAGQDKLIKDIQQTAQTAQEKEVARVLTEAHEAFNQGNTKGVVDSLSQLVDFENQSN